MDSVPVCAYRSIMVTSDSSIEAVSEVDDLKQRLDTFIVAAETTHMAMTLTNAKVKYSPIVFANDSFLKLTGYTREEVLDRPIIEILTDMTDSAATKRIETALAQGFDGTLEIECRRKDGKSFLAAIYMSAIRDKADKIDQHFISLVDLSRHVEKLVQQRNDLYAVYRHAPGFIATSNGPDHRFTFANESYLKLVGRRGLDGQTVVEALPEIVEQGFVGLLDEVYTTGRPFNGRDMPISLQRSVGEPPEIRYVDFVYHPVRNAQGVIEGLFCEGHDVTDRHRALDEVTALQNELIHMSRISAMETMASTLAHELNQPLAAIANYTAACRHLVDNSTERAGALVNALVAIGESTMRAGDIIRHLRDMTKRGHTERTFFDLKEAIRECLQFVRVSAGEGVILDDQSVGGVELEADRIQVQQVVMNLLRNACEAAVSSPQARVTISTTIAGGVVTVSVHDNGPGVPDSVARSMFNGVQSAKNDGMGIGLSICRTIIEAHNGRIWLQSSGSGGSCVSFALPQKVVQAIA